MTLHVGVSYWTLLQQQHVILLSHFFQHDMNAKVDQKPAVGGGGSEGKDVERCETEVNQQTAAARKTQGLDSGQKAGASTANHQFRYSSVICLHIVSAFPQTDPVF